MWSEAADDSKAHSWVAEHTDSNWLSEDIAVGPQEGA